MASAMAYSRLYKRREFNYKLNYKYLQFVMLLLNAFIYRITNIIFFTVSTRIDEMKIVVIMTHLYIYIQKKGHGKGLNTQNSYSYATGHQILHKSTPVYSRHLN